MLGVVVLFERLFGAVVGFAEHFDLSLQFKYAVLKHLGVELVFAIPPHFGSSVGYELFLAFAYLFVRGGTVTQIVFLYVFGVVVRRLLGERMLLLLRKLPVFELEWPEQGSKVLIVFNKLYLKKLLHVLLQIHLYNYSEETYQLVSSHFI